MTVGSLDGWSVEPVRVLGSKEEVGDGYFRLGKRPQIRAIHLPKSKKEALLAANELGDLRLYAGISGNSPTLVPLHVVGDAGPDDLDTWGGSGTGIPDIHPYAAAFPRRDGEGWDIVAIQATRGQRRGLWIGEDGGVKIDWPRPMENRVGSGIPEAVDWRRDGRYDLLLGKPDGTLCRFPRKGDAELIEFDSTGEPVIAGTAPLKLPGPVCPCVLDWYAKGGSDLLLGAGDGFVWLFRDIGDEGEVRYDRGRLLVNADGYLRVDGPASPTVLEEGGARRLVVADGEGVLWRWEIKTVESYVTSDLHKAFGGEANGVCQGYRKGRWWIGQEAGRTVLNAAPETLPQQSKHNEVPVVFDPLAPELRVKPPVSGMCEIHVTLYHPVAMRNQPKENWSLSFCRKPIVRVRLSDDPVREYITTGEFTESPEQEVFFKSADLTGREICFSQMVGDHRYEGGFPAHITSVRLVPVGPTPSALRRKHPVVAGICDTQVWVWQTPLDTVEEVDEFVELHQRAGIEVFYMKLGGASWEYPSKHEDARGVTPDLPGYSEADKRYCEKLIEMLERVNRVKMAAEACHRRGMRCIGQMRIQNASEYIAQQINLDRFFVEHPELLEKNLEGTTIPKLCLAYPEVQDYYNRIAVEVIDFGLDGIMVETLRHLPKVLWGDPVVEEFREHHALDMRALPPFDPRVVELQCDIFKRFVRSMRNAIKEANPDAELHIRLCKSHPLMGVDPEALAREGLVDQIIINHRADAPREPDIEGIVRITRGTECRACAGVARTHSWGTEGMPLHPYVVEQKAKEFAQAGAAAVAFYETLNVLVYPEMRRAIRRISDPSVLPSRMF